MSKINTELSSYDDIAAEYYDSVRHPTCANFSELSERFLAPRVGRYASESTEIVEVGVGRSIVAPIMVMKGLPLGGLTLLDESPRMLEHSRKWVAHGARLVIGDARNTGLPAARFQLVVSSLGDPYNEPRFWREVSRILVPGGVCLFTMPAPEWSRRFRAGADPGVAEFVLVSGRRALVCSNIPPIGRQMEMIAEAALHVDEVQAFSAADLAGMPSPKLLVNDEAARLPVVRGFTVKKT